MTSKELKTDWLYRLKRKMLLSILGVLTVAIVVTMVFIAIKLRTTLVNDSKAKTQELAVTINSTLKQMMISRTPEAIQETLTEVVSKNDSISQAFILNNQGNITYSSDEAKIGSFLNRYEEPSCRVCHTRSGVVPGTDALILEGSGETHRNISLIYNEKACMECHDQTATINGKLIIDRSLDTTFSLITSIQLILFGSGLVSLLILIPLFSKMLSRGINQYILEIFTRNEELRLLYAMVERLSKTLDIALLKEIVIDIFREVLAADEMVLVLAKGAHDYSASVWTSKSGKIERMKMSEDDSANAMLQSWLDGSLGETKVSADAREICMPIEKGGNRLALVVARKADGCFDGMRLNLSSVIRSHIAVAFDNARLYYIAITDELTKTFTKRHFRQCLDQTFLDYQKYGNKFALLMMDLDKFKQVNDTHGHVVGDEVLQQLGEILHHSVRENDLVFRYGGEEFTVILPAADAKAACVVAERIRAATEAAVFAPGTDLKLTISIGVATCPDAPSVHAVVVDADQALYAAKHQGRNQVILSEKEYDSP
jgi:diguanylate cyclase (GGDEF)-like protein